MSRARLKKALQKRYLHWRSASLNPPVLPRAVHPDYLFPSRSNSRRSTRNKHSHCFLLLSPGHPHTPMDHQTLASSPRLLPLREVQAPSLSPKPRRGPRRALRPPGPSNHRRVRSRLLPVQRLRAHGAPAVPIWAQMSGHVSGRIIMSVHRFRFNAVALLMPFFRKKSSADGAGISTRGLMSSAASCQTGQARRRKARSSRARCSTSIT